MLGLALVFLREGTAGCPARITTASTTSTTSRGGGVRHVHLGPADGHRGRVPIESDALQAGNLLLRHARLLPLLVQLVFGPLVGHPPAQLVGRAALVLLVRACCIVVHLVLVGKEVGGVVVGGNLEVPGPFLEGDGLLVLVLPLLVGFAPLGLGGVGPAGRCGCWILFEVSTT